MNRAPRPGSAAAGSGPVRVGIDLGGTGTRFVAVDDDSVVVATATFATPVDLAPAAARSFLVREARAVAAGRSISAVGIGASGPIDREGVIRNPETLPAFTDVELLAPIAAELAAPVRIDNDAVTAALYEVSQGAARGSTSTLMVTLGTGVGVAALRGIEPVRGSDGTHPEAGHLSVTGAHAPCYCGRLACWEQLVSRSALQRAAGSLLRVAKGTATDIDDAAERAQQGNADAIAIFDAFGRHLAEGLADLLTVVRSSCVVLGGSAARYQPAFGPELNRRLAEIDLYGPVPPVRISSAGVFGGAIGAAYLAPN
ncbi:ROK family protein [Microbacterium sp. NPDC019599]|uniref:ROK family protein n=1 Tax=Microbacterium sp. NPDC019599 TaxID=3154690 RepID=UPI0034109672